MTQTIPLASDARERFLLEIAAVLAPARIVEAYFFAPMRQGQIETGVCVLGALPEGADPLPVSAGTDVNEPAVSEGGEAAVTDRPLSETPEPGEEAVPPLAAPEPADTAGAHQFPEGARISSRHVVYSARYRWTRKGPERGKWNCEVIAEADAPLLTVEAVVQGVQQRASEPLAVEKVDGEVVRAMIAQAQHQWSRTA